MPLRLFHLRPGEELRPGLGRIVGEIAKKAAHLAEFRAGKAEDAIHDTRLFIKLLRTLAWTAQPALAPEINERIKAHLRAAADCLADPRDAAVLTATLGKLARKAAGSQQRTGYELAEKTLAADLAVPGEAAARRHLAQAGRELREAATLFAEAAAGSVEPWPTADQRQVKAVRACRRAMKRALSSGQPEDFHDWRKRAKRLLLQARVIAVNRNAETEHPELTLVDRLQAKLGDHHDLVVLEEHLRRNEFPPDGSRPARKVLREIGGRRKMLEKRVASLARRWRKSDKLKT